MDSILDRAEEKIKQKLYLDALYEIGGYYQCPKDVDGKRLGHLVGYAGRYGSDNKQFVGENYINFAKAEEYTTILYDIADDLLEKIPESLDTIDVFCGMPMGGVALAVVMATMSMKKFAHPEKKITTLATASSREKSELVWGRHTITAGDNVVLVEDVANNFSTTSSAIDLVLQEGGEVIAIVCFLNRSTVVGDSYYGIPVIALVREPMPEWAQEDPAVADDIQAGNVVWKPKETESWARLMVAMESD
jgi:orotate phosphoribosyltransferase